MLVFLIEGTAQDVDVEIYYNDKNGGHTLKYIGEPLPFNKTFDLSSDPDGGFIFQLTCKYDDTIDATMEASIEAQKSDSDTIETLDSESKSGKSISISLTTGLM